MGRNFLPTGVTDRWNRKGFRYYFYLTDYSIFSPAEIDPAESQLKNRKKKYRYLLEGNYKIIYSVEGILATISSVFDCRQNPKKIKRIITPN